MASSKCFFFSSGDKNRFALPESMPILHMEVTEFYYPGDKEFPRKLLYFIFESIKDRVE